ncbi:MAG TPA: protein kinase [Anaeromyxobacteraceae bacterium]|nr:protein kinase [Anaeromyxobacteraceae bacterium]
MPDGLSNGDGSSSERTGAPGQLSALLQDLARAPAEDLARAWDRPLRPGDAVGRFEILREIGRGGFGVVYQALDRQLGRSVAFKTLRPARSGHELSAGWILREAEAVARLDHPAIVTLHEVGRCDSGPYLVEELLHGETLEERLRRGPLPAREASAMALEVAKGVAHAHGHGVVHRDLKPGNVFLTKDGRVKLLDFGLAHLLGTKGLPGAGTPAYMAPEQLRGEAADPRVDVFALAATLFEALSGKPPFEVREGRSAALDGKPAPALPAGTPAPLARLVERCLSRDPARRPASGQAVVEELLAVQRALERAGEEPRSGVVGGASRARLALALLGLGLLAAAPWLIDRVVWTGAPATGAGSPPEPAGPRTVAVLPLVNLSGDAAQEYFNDGMTEEITSRLSRLEGLAVTARTSVSRYKGSRQTAREIGGELAVSFLVEGSVRRAGDRIRVTASLVRTSDAVRIWSEDLDGRLDDVFAVQERIASRIVEALGLKLTPGELRTLRAWGTRNAAAYDEYLKGQERYGEGHHSRAAVGEAMAHFRRALALDERFAPALAGLASGEALIYRDWDGNPERLDRAEALAGRALALDPQLPPALKAAADIRGYRFDYLGAAEQFRRVVDLTPRDHVAWDQLCWALGYATPPALDEAESACRRALALAPAFPAAHYHLLRVHVLAGRLDEAEADLGALRRTPAGDFVEAGRFWVAMGRDRPAEALGSLQGRTTNLDLAWRAMALAQLGRKDEAFAALEASLAAGYRDAADLGTSRWYQPLRRDQRWTATLRRHRLAP